MTYSFRPAAPCNRTLLRAVAVSIAMHAGLLYLIPVIQNGGQSRHLRTPVRAVLGEPEQVKNRPAAAGSAPVLVRQDRVSDEGKSTAPGVGSAVPRRRPVRRGELTPAQSSQLAQTPTPDAVALSAEPRALDAAALRGVRVGLALGLRGLVLPSALVGSRTLARLTFGTGGQLLALSFSGEGASAALGRLLRQPLTRVARGLVLPPQLLAERFEVELQLEFAD